MEKTVIAIIFAIVLLAGCSAKEPFKGVEGKLAKNMGNPENRNGRGTSTIDENTGTQADEGKGGGILPEKVFFTTQDGFRIAGNFWKGGQSAVLLMHQFQAGKETYGGFAKKLNDANFTVLAIDLRGHGESLDQNGLRRGFATFSESDFRNMELDAKAAKNFLAKQGFSLKVVVGSSIGANTALNYAASDSSIQNAVLLSTGLNYKGIETESRAPEVKAKTLIVASEEDDYSYGSSKALQEMIPNSEFLGLRGAGHGTNMFRGTNLENEIIGWLAGN